MTKSERILDLLEHFYQGAMSYGGHPIWVKPEDASIIKKDLKKALRVTKEGGKFKAHLLKNPVWPSEYVIEMLTYERDIYRDENDKFYRGIKALID